MILNPHSNVTPEVVTGAGTSVLVVIDGELDAAAGPALHGRVLPAAAGRRQAVLDLRSVTFVDLDGARALAELCEALRARSVETSVIPSVAVEQLVERLTEVGVDIHLPLSPPLLDADAHAISFTLRPATPALRPVEARVLHLLDEQGLSVTEVAFRFQRSIRWVEQVADNGRRRRGSRSLR